MFAVDVTEFGTAAQEVLQIAQNVRVAAARVKGANDSLFTSGMMGSWFKTGSTQLSIFKNKVGDVETLVTNTADVFMSASSDLTDKVQPAYRSIFTAAGTQTSARVIKYDNQSGEYAISCHGSLITSKNSLNHQISLATSEASYLDAGASITTQLGQLRDSVKKASDTADNTEHALEQYRTIITNFEDVYAKLFNKKALESDILSRLGNGIGDVKGFLGIGSHGIAISKLVGSLLDGSYQYESSLPPLFDPDWKTYLKSAGRDGIKAGWKGITSSFDFGRASKWKDAWDQLKSGVAAEKASDSDFFRTVVGKGGEASKATARLEAGGKIIGYAADVLVFAGIANKAVQAGAKQKGDAADKIAAGGLEAAKGVAKFVVGKAAGKAGSAIGATIGSAIFPPVGTIVGGAIGGAVATWGANTLWNAGEKLIKETKVHDKIVKGLGKVVRARPEYRAAKFAVSGIKWLASGWK